MKWKVLAVLLAVAMIGFASAPATLAAPENPYLQPDESWISISGTAVEADGDSFVLDYGRGTVTIEMDDWDWWKKENAVIEGDKVTVYGEVDDDLYETTTIEASSVYVENLGTYFYASTADEEYDDDYDYWLDPDPIEVGRTTLRGTVTGVDGREFTIDTGPRRMTVDTVAMPYNPLDDKGYQRIDEADYVSVTGNIDDDTWEERELMAANVIILDND